MSSYTFSHGSTNHSSCSTCSQILRHWEMQQLCCASKYPMLTRMQDISKVPGTKDTIRFKLDTQEITYTMDMFCDTLKLPVETQYNPFIAPVMIKTIETFMQTVGYQGVVDKKKINILQLFHDVVNHTNIGYAALLWWDFMNCNYPSIPQILDEDYHSIKDDILLEYETVFIGVDVPMNQPQQVVSTQGAHRTTPRAHRTPTLTTASPHGKKRKQSA
ncbi:hypothetical protein Tco_1091055 [Tanacetum coccineum]|uniref:Uncharacterized protein n=1 Tax=Tanacetum coccineum TaxID=301880 RepID=A0ABQ5I5Y1_9ASTR